MFCARCGHSIQPGDAFCDRCGARSEGWQGPVLASVPDEPGPAPAAPVKALIPPDTPPATRPAWAPAAGQGTVGGAGLVGGAAFGQGAVGAPAFGQGTVAGPGSVGAPAFGQGAVGGAAVGQPGGRPARPATQAGPPARTAPPSAPAYATPPVRPVPASPARPSGPSGPLIAMLVVLALSLMALAGVLAWRFLPDDLWSFSKPTATPTAATATDTSTPTPTSTPTGATTVGPFTTPTPSSGVRNLEDFAGSWTTDEPGSDVIRFRVEDETLVADIPEENAEVRLSRLNPNDSILHGSYTSGPDSIPLTAELSADGTRLILILAPPNSEFERAELVRPQSTPGIESLDLSDPTTYLPLMDLKLTYQVEYPDGDSGRLIRLACQVDPRAPRSVLETWTSTMYTGSPNYEVMHYVVRSDGLRRISDLTGEEELWLPGRVAVGATWSSHGWEHRVRALDEPLDLGFLQLRCLAVERQSDALGVKESLWIAPGYGEVLAKLGGSEARRLTAVDQADPAGAEREVRRHAKHLEERL